MSLQSFAEQASHALRLLGQVSALATLSQTDAFTKAFYLDWGAGLLTDDQAEQLAQSIEARRQIIRPKDRVAVRAPEVATQAREAGRLSYFPPKRKQPRSTDRCASIARRRTLAASGPMPPALASHFTTGELAALRIVADECRDRGSCSLYLGEIAARAGVGITTARNALRAAALDGLVVIEERRRDKRPNLSNVIRITSREWKLWIERQKPRRSTSESFAGSKGGGSKKPQSTDNPSFRRISGERALRAQHPQNVAQPPQKAASAQHT